MKKENKNIKEQPKPLKNNSKPVWKMVMSDMSERNMQGVDKYKTELQSFNGRNSIIDAYQEVLDMSAYLRQHIEERNVIMAFLKKLSKTTTYDRLVNCAWEAEQLLIKLGEKNETK